MREDLANLVHPILAYALAVKERLDRGEAVALDVEQAALKSLLLTELESKRWLEYGGEVRLPTTAPEKAESDATPRPEPFLGGRYALVCWLDELFILYSPWSALWNERKLEVALYGSNERAWKFWQQAQLAEVRSTADALEVFFLAVMLGFRGELGDALEQLRAWVGANQARLTRAARRSMAAAAGTGSEYPRAPVARPRTLPARGLLWRHFNAAADPGNRLPGRAAVRHVIGGLPLVADRQGGAP